MITKLVDRWTESIQERSNTSREKILEYYQSAGPDYADWSETFNMHFGYYRLGDNPFNLEAMLNGMNREVLDRLKLADENDNRILDMGCGLGATVRYAINRTSIKKVTGITIVPWQIQEAERLIKKEQYLSKANFELQDYQATTYEENTYDGIYAIESACHAKGSTKKLLLKEAYRILKPNNKIVIADAFLKRKDKGNSLHEYMYKKMCEYWAVEEFGKIQDVEKAMIKIGYKNIQIEEASWRIAPSVMYIPYVASKYFLTKVIPTLFVDKQRWNHCMASFYALLVGMNRRRFGYYIISAEK